MPQCQRRKVNGHRCSRQSEGQYCWQHKAKLTKQRGGFSVTPHQSNEREAQLERDRNLIQQAINNRDCSILNQVHNWEPFSAETEEHIVKQGPCFAVWMLNNHPHGVYAVGQVMMEESSMSLLEALRDYYNRGSSQDQDKIRDLLSQILHDMYAYADPPDPAYIQRIKPQLELWGIDIDWLQELHQGQQNQGPRVSYRY